MAKNSTRKKKKLKFKKVRVVDGGCEHSNSDGHAPHWFRKCCDCGAVALEVWMTHADIMSGVEEEA